VPGGGRGLQRMIAAGPVGVGIGLRRQHLDAITKTERRIDWIEIIPENFMGFGGHARRALDKCSQRWPVAVHGVALSLGGPDPLDQAYLAELGSLLDRVGAAWFSEHACWSAIGGVQTLDLLPLPFTETAAEHLAARTRHVADRIGLPLLLENITYYAEMPTSVLSEGAFLREVLQRSGAGLLLDVNNVYVNACNHGVDPRAALEALPIERTRQIHLAGHRREGDVLLDDHGSAVHDPVLDLYAFALERTGPVPTLIEWDNRVPPLDVLLDDADRVRAVYEAASRRALAGAA
jgi:hypothetical protein